MHQFTYTYTDAARKLQDRFDTRNLADAELAVIVHDELTDMDKGFISAMEMFWLASVDDKGSPTVSFKGGAPGFVKVLDDRTLLFPNYDGNGMYFSMGNIATSAQVGMLFMAFDRPARLRVQGHAQLTDDPALVGHFPGAQFAVQVNITALITNCPRYIPRMHRPSPRVMCLTRQVGNPFPAGSVSTLFRPCCPRATRTKPTPWGA